MRLKLLVALGIVSCVAGPSLADTPVFRYRSAGAGASSPTLPGVLTASSTGSRVDVGGTFSPFSATGGKQPYAWSASGLPSGVSIAPDGRVTVTVEGSWTGIAATVTDAEGAKATATANIDASFPEGTLMSFGQNFHGQVVPGQTGTVATPSAIGSSTDWTVVSGNGDGSCGIRKGDLYCWGGNSEGQLGTGDTANVTGGPRLVSSGGWTAVQGSRSTSSHACGVRYGTMNCWGRNSGSQVGDGTAVDRTAPVAIDGGSTGWTAVSTGSWHSCGIKLGKAYCWGMSIYGGVGDTTGSTRDKPVLVGGGTGSSGWTEISSGSYATCGIRSGALLCWGQNSQGQLGANGTTNSNRPVEVLPGTTGWSGVSFGNHHACALRDGTAYCWGSNHQSQVGIGTTADVTTGPAAVGGGTGTKGWTRLAAGQAHTCGIRAGALLCWGMTTQGQGGVSGPVRLDLPTRVGADSSWKDVSAALSHTVAVK